ncbi:MAG: DUF4115 domain-containing protein [Armatimonadota bacterium]|nr:DUF4115 domain-containing protein [Armatimonadota bacterium]
MTSSEPSRHRPEGAGIGTALRAARQARGLTLADLQARTKISARFLAALENEAFDDLPPFPYARGFLRAVARELELDSAALVDRLAGTMRPPRASGLVQAVRSPITPAQPRSRLRRIVTSVGIALAVVLVASVVYLGQQLREFSRPQATPETPATPAASQRAGPDTAPPTDTPPAAPPAPAAAPLSPAGADVGATEGQGVVVEIQALGRSWILVRSAQGPLFEGFVTAGQIRRWQSDGPVTLRVGNAAAVVLTVNGRPLGPLGRPGEVVSRTFGREPLP